MLQGPRTEAIFLDCPEATKTSQNPNVGTEGLVAIIPKIPSHGLLGSRYRLNLGYCPSQ